MTALLAVLLVATLSATADSQDAGSDVQWLSGPATATLGDDVAQVRVPAGYAFAGAEDTGRLMKKMGNVVNGSEVGLILPRSEENAWFAVFEYRAVGYVRDDDRDEIDADALLGSIKEATEEANKERKQHGIPGLHVVGWIEKPNYDARTHNLQWAMLARDDSGADVANYNVRLLGRHGYMSVTLVDEPDRLATAKSQFEQMLGGFSYRPGKTYAEYVSGDHVAQIGLAALIAGGAGAAAAKLGLFGKLGALVAAAWKAILVGVLGIASFFTRLLRRLFGTREVHERPTVEPPSM